MKYAWKGICGIGMLMCTIIPRIILMKIKLRKRMMFFVYILMTDE